MKPEWKDAPEWANYLAMDADGTWAWFEDAPYISGDEWVYTRIDAMWAFATRRTDNRWMHSLEPRP